MRGEVNERQRNRPTRPWGGLWPRSRGRRPLCPRIPAPQVGRLRLPGFALARLTVGPAHGVVERAGDAPPRGALGGVAGVHAPCVLIVAPVQLVLKEISLVIVGPGEGGIDAARREAEVRDRPRVSFLYVIVLKHPVSVSWGGERKSRGPRLAPSPPGGGPGPCFPRGLTPRCPRAPEIHRAPAVSRAGSHTCSSQRTWGLIRRPHHRWGQDPHPTRRSHFGLRGLFSQFCGKVGEYAHRQEGRWVKVQLDLIGYSLV